MIQLIIDNREIIYDTNDNDKANYYLFSSCLSLATQSNIKEIMNVFIKGKKQSGGSKKDNNEINFYEVFSGKMRGGGGNGSPNGSDDDTPVGNPGGRNAAAVAAQAAQAAQPAAQGAAAAEPAADQAVLRVPGPVAGPVAQLGQRMKVSGRSVLQGAIGIANLLPSIYLELVERNIPNDPDKLAEYARHHASLVTDLVQSRNAEVLALSVSNEGLYSIVNLGKDIERVFQEANSDLKLFKENKHLLRNRKFTISNLGNIGKNKRVAKLFEVINGVLRRDTLEVGYNSERKDLVMENNMEWNKLKWIIT
jgi:hypothetical protein